MASRKEQKEQLRAERLAAEQQSHTEQRRKRVVGLGIAGLLALAALGVIVLVVASGGGGEGGNDCADAHIVNEPGLTTTAKAQPDCRSGTKSTPGELITNIDEAAKAAGCTVSQPKDAGNQHLGPDDKAPKYKAKPPTSGTHDAVPLADGAYETSPPARHFIHTLEHGRVGFLYSPKLAEADQLRIKGVFDETWQYLIVLPYEDMPFQVAAIGWGQLLGCREFNDKTLDALRAFRDSYRGNGPEPAGSQPG